MGRLFFLTNLQLTVASSLFACSLQILSSIHVIKKGLSLSGHKCHKNLNLIKL